MVWLQSCLWPVIPLTWSRNTQPGLLGPEGLLLGDGGDVSMRKGVQSRKTLLLCVVLSHLKKVDDVEGTAGTGSPWRGQVLPWLAAFARQGYAQALQIQINSGFDLCMENQTWNKPAWKTDSTLIYE